MNVNKLFAYESVEQMLRRGGEYSEAQELAVHRYMENTARGRCNHRFALINGEKGGVDRVVCVHCGTLYETATDEQVAQFQKAMGITPTEEKKPASKKKVAKKKVARKKRPRKK